MFHKAAEKQRSMGQEFSENLLTALWCFNNFRAQSLGRERAKRAATLILSEEKAQVAGFLSLQGNGQTKIWLPM
jgi:hypothetical protein